MSEDVHHQAIDAATKAIQRMGMSCAQAASAFNEFNDAWRRGDRDRRALAKFRAQVRLKLRGKNWRAAK